MTKDGGRRLIAWSNRLMPGQDGEPLYLVTAGIDLTDRARNHEDGALEGDPEAKLAEIGQLAQEQRALRRVATLVASEVSPERVFMAVSEETARVLEVNASAVFRYEGDDTATVVGRHDRNNVGAAKICPFKSDIPNPLSCLSKQCSCLVRKQSGDTINWDQWKMEGEKTFRDRAAEVIAESLSNYDLEPLEPKLHTEIRDLFQRTANDKDVKLPAFE